MDVRPQWSGQEPHPHLLVLNSTRWVSASEVSRLPRFVPRKLLVCCHSSTRHVSHQSCPHPPPQLKGSQQRGTKKNTFQNNLHPALRFLFCINQRRNVPLISVDTRITRGKCHNQTTLFQRSCPHHCPPPSPPRFNFQEAQRWASTYIALLPPSTTAGNQTHRTGRKRAQLSAART